MSNTTMEAILDQPLKNEVSFDQTLRSTVQRVLQNYCIQLGDVPITNLHEMVIAEVMPPMLEVALKFNNNNQSKTAKMLGLSRGTLRKLIEEHKILTEY